MSGILQPGTWTRHGGIIWPTEVYEQDANGIGLAFEPSVVKDGATWKMWYTCYGGVLAAGAAVAYATASSPLGPWTKHGIVKEAHDEATVTKIGDTYHMISIGYPNYQTVVYYNTSADGIAWGDPEVVLEAGVWDANMCNPFPFLAPNGTWYLYYETPSNGLGVATAGAIGGPYTKISTDGPIFFPFSAAACGPMAVTIGDYNYLYYHAHPHNGDRIYRAHGTDPLVWTVDAYPMMHKTGVEEGGGIPAAQIADAFIVVDDRLWLFYCANTNATYSLSDPRAHIALASAPLSEGPMQGAGYINGIYMPSIATIGAQRTYFAPTPEIAIQAVSDASVSTRMRALRDALTGAANSYVTTVT